MYKLPPEIIPFIVEEQSHLWQEIRHNDRLRWLLLVGWIAALAWILGCVFNAPNDFKSILSILAFLFSLFSGIIVMCFHALERNKSGEFAVTKDIIRRALCGKPVNEKPSIRSFKTAWKGTDGIYTYLIALFSAGGSTVILSILTNKEQVHLSIYIAQSLLIAFLLYLLFRCFYYSRKTGKKEIKDKRTFKIFVLGAYVFSFFIFIIFFIEQFVNIEISRYIDEFLYIIIIVLLDLLTYACIIIFGSNQYSVLTDEWFVFLNRESEIWN